MKYSDDFNPRKTPQSESIPGKDMVANSAGGFVFAINDWSRFDRFVVIGSEGGTYYAKQKPLTVENCQNIVGLIKSDGVKVIDRLVEISDSGRAPKNEPAIFALALCYTVGDNDTKMAARDALPKICRIGTHLFTFVSYVNDLRGWGRSLRNGVANWYNDMSPQKLALQLVKYRQRNGWTHADVLRLSHPSNIERNDLYAFATRTSERPFIPEKKHGLLYAFDLIQSDDSKEKVIELIKEYDMPRETLPTQWLTDPDIWNALLQKMPMTALIRNLGNMSKIGLIKQSSDAAKLAVEKISDTESLRKSRIHPIQVLSALMTYSSGEGMRGSGSWVPVPKVVDALDNAFYESFKNIEPTEKKWLLGIDVSGSMDFPSSMISSFNFTARHGAVAMAMATMRSEEECLAMAFCDTFRPFPMTAKTTLASALASSDRMAFGRTDCALPMIYAIKHKLDIDVFVIYTDSETWYGHIHPVQALNEYRRKFNPNAKLVVVGMTSTGFSIADPDDSGMLDVVGFDSASPQIIANFARE